MKKRLFTLHLFVLTSALVFAQLSGLPTSEDLNRQFEQLEPISLFEPISADDQRAPDVQDVVRNASFLKVIPSALTEVRSNAPEFLALEIPMNDGETLQLSLYKVDVLAEGFILKASSNPDQQLAYTGPLHYRGVMKGAHNSVAAISILDGEIMGLASNGRGNIVIGQSGDPKDRLHIIYNDKDLLSGPNFDCGTPDDGRGYTLEELKGNYTQRDVGDCVNVYIEIDDDIVSQKGGVTQATDYVTGLFNESITLYAWDGIEMAISEILAWDTPAPYSGSSSSAMLSSFQSNTGAFNGDLAHLVSYQASGGIAAGFAGLCNANVDNSKCFSSIDATYSDVPTYSWSVMVVTHEMGHLLGSRHTHACVWNGNNTAIDGCAGSTEGSCSNPGNPAGGGTIMSYCHLTSVGINLNLGFGEQPLNVVLGQIANASCLDPCTPPAPDDAGISASGGGRAGRAIRQCSNATRFSG